MSRWFESPYELFDVKAQEKREQQEQERQELIDRAYEKRLAEQPPYVTAIIILFSDGTHRIQYSITGEGPTVLPSSSLEK